MFSRIKDEETEIKKEISIKYRKKRNNNIKLYHFSL